MPPVARKKPGAKPPAKTYALPKSPSTRANALQDLTMIWYGREKIGKTALAAQFPDAIFLMCEPGAKDLEVYQVPVTTWQDFLGYARQIKAEPRFKTVIIDTVDLAYQYCEHYVCQKLAIDHPSDEEWGKGWKAVKDEFTSAIVQLASCGKGVIFISHDKEMELKKRGGDKQHRIVPTMSKGARSVIEPMVDVFAYLDYDGDERVMRIRGDDFITAGTRLGSRFVGVEEIRLGRSPQEAYANFMKAWSTVTEASAGPALQQRVAALQKGGAAKRIVRRK